MSSLQKYTSVLGNPMVFTDLTVTFLNLREQIFSRHDVVWKHCQEKENRSFSI